MSGVIAMQRDLRIREMGTVQQPLQ
jgi:hypothetical protein